MAGAVDDAGIPMVAASGTSTRYGTATRFNDATEAIAITAVCPGALVSSTQSMMMGHFAFGAAGAVEAVFTVLALARRPLPTKPSTSTQTDPKTLH